MGKDLANPIVSTGGKIKMLETTKEICKHCGKEYDDTHVIPRAPYAPGPAPEGCRRP